MTAQSIDTRFGKNRVQYHDDFDVWDKYETENFIIHWYGKARNVAKAVIPMAEYYHDEIVDVLEHRMNDKIQIIIYVDISDLNQSNIGNDDTWTSRSGETKIIGNKMFVYFDGNHQNLRKQIKEGIASVYLASMLFGSNFQEIVQNAVLLNLPDWYKKGIVSYAGSNWDLEIEDELRDIWAMDDDYHKYKKLANDYPRVAGHSMWYFISQYYSPTAIPNILYLTKIARDLEESFVYVLSENEKTVYNAWSDYYTDYFAEEKNRYSPPLAESKIELKNKDYVPISKMRISPDARFLAYAFNEIGQYRVVVREIASGEEKTVFKYGYKNALQEPDYNYPVFDWSQNSQELILAYENRDVIKLRKINLRDDQFVEQIIPENIHRIYEIGFLDDDTYLINGSTRGYSDLFTYNPVQRVVTNLTNDFYDDLDARISIYQGDRGILFSSNRESTVVEELEMDTILPLGNFDIFFYNLQNDQVIKLTETENQSERFPMIADQEGRLVYINDASGLRNTFSTDPFSGRGYAVSNLDRNIIIHEHNASSNLYIYMMYRSGAYTLYLEENKDWSKPISTSSTPLKRKLNKVKEVLIPLLPQEQEEEDMQDEYMFITRFEDPEVVPKIRAQANQINIFQDIAREEDILGEGNSQIEEFNSSRVTASRLTFKLDNFTTKMDNSVLFEGLESYTGEPDQLDYNPTGLLVKATMKDIFEDYSLEGGVRIPTTFDGSEYFLVFDDKKDLIDKRYAIYRKVHTDFSSNNLFPQRQSKKNSLLGMYQLKYPFDVYRSVRMTSTLRFDKFYFQSSENSTFAAPVTNEKRLGLKFEYIYDNTIDIDDNIRHGTRYKAYVEGINRFNFELADGFNVDPSEAFTTIIGFDFRHYIPFLEHSIIALRGSAATSFGSEKMMYYLGGVNGWLFQKFNNNTPVPGGDFAFKTGINQMRGFDFNIRNGSSYALVNTELRIPFIKYIAGRNVKSGFFRNLQVVGFFDAGTAWHGSSPFDEDNPINTQTITSTANGVPIIEVTVDYFRDPLVMGYGAGLRTKILGYNLKFDYAWGIETRQIQKPKLYIAIGTDF
jgi:hypothetical protein